VSLPGDEVASLVSPLNPGQVQPAGVDLRVSKVYRFLSGGVLGEERELPRVEELEPVEGYWVLRPGAYKVRFAEVVSVPLTLVGLCFPRSSLLRMGALLACTVWDPGYRGRGEALLAVLNEHGLRLEVGARVAQLVFIRMDKRPKQGYRGVYLGENINDR
jgi:dUTP pyrophosphatase